jgi:hypothetical protein
MQSRCATPTPPSPLEGEREGCPGAKSLAILSPGESRLSPATPVTAGCLPTPSTVAAQGSGSVPSLPGEGSVPSPLAGEGGGHAAQIGAGS